MAIGAASGTPQYSGNFIPEKWSTQLLVKFYATTVLAAISNTDYEGEIKNQGDKVIIRQRADITIGNYVKNGTTSWELPDIPVVEFPIEKAKYFAFKIDSVDKYQSDIKLMEEWAKDATEQMKITIDDEALADFYSDAHASNKGNSAGAKSGDIALGTTGTPVAVTRTNVLDLFIDADVTLTEQNVPETNRWFVIPPWMWGMLMKSDLKDVSMTGDGQSILRNGRIGRIGNFTLYVSNLLTSVTDGSFTCWHLVAGQKKALTFASQFTQMQYFAQLENTFGSGSKGLNVYDYKVLKPEALCDIYVRKAA